LEEYKKESDVEVYDFEIWDQLGNVNEDNIDILSDVSEKLKVEVPGVPFTVICGETIVGFDSSGTTAVRIDNLVNECLNSGCNDPVRDIILGEEDVAGSECSESESVVEDEEDITSISQDKINVPLVGEVDLGKLSLPVITLLIGFLDGFNPCAMWVLLYLISMLLGMKDRKKMWFIGITFIVSSAFVYFLFMTSWLNFFLFIGFVKWVRILIGAVAIFSASIHLRDWWESKTGCKVTDTRKRKRISERIKRIINSKRVWMMIPAIIFLAFSVNLIELVCSAGFPAIYTHMLSLSDLSTLQYYLYLLLYVFMFMIDDMVIFVIAMVTLHAAGISTKYKKISSLVGGILILLIGILLIFKPEILMFG
jgi:hypothetical protein